MQSILFVCDRLVVDVTGENEENLKFEAETVYQLIICTEYCRMILRDWTLIRH